MKGFLGVPEGPYTKMLRMLSKFPPEAWAPRGKGPELAKKVLDQTKRHNPELVKAMEGALAVIQSSAGPKRASDDLHTALLKLAHDVPATRKHLIPLLRAERK